MKPTAASSLKQIIASAWLALAFLGAQQAAVLHWLSHSIEAAAEARPAAASPGAGEMAAAHHCDACLAFSALGAGAAAAVEFRPAPLPTAGCAAVGVDAEARPTALFLAFRSRAPPALV